MKKILIPALIALLACPFVGSAEILDTGFEYATSGDVKVGEWNSQYSKVMDMAHKDGIPVVVFWARKSCGMCKALERQLATSEAIAWAQDSGYLFLFALEGSADSSKVLALCQTGVSLPFAGVYWDKNADGKPDVQQKWCGRKGSMPVKTGELLSDFIESVEKYLGTYVNYNGGEFAAGEDAGNRMECEAATEYVAVELVREGSAASSAAEVTLEVTGPNGYSEVYDVVWAAGETSRTVEVDVSQVGFTTDGQKLELALVDSRGTTQSNSSITFVKKEASASNPLWIGERSTGFTTSATSSVPTLDFGEWTMDLDAAKALAKAKSGYVCVSMQGSMWCPDCANTDRNFLEVKKSGENLFCKWAKEHKVALVSCDIPNFTGKGAEDFATPCLLSRKPYATALARAKEWPMSGAAASLTNKVMRSGVGYQTRKGISEADALKQLAKFQKLANTNTDAGGFHRPEDGNANRTGVPIFVLLRADGTVAARFTRLASVSPMKYSDASKSTDISVANAEALLLRFEEMLAIADAKSGEVDASEIGNNYPSSGSVALTANGGSASGRLCNADFIDTFKLNGMSGNALQKVTVKGTSSAKVKVSYYNPEILTDAGKMQVLATATGKLSAGVTLSAELTKAGDYYVQVEGADITATEFDAYSKSSSNFVDFTISGETVLVPQDGMAEANAAADSDTIRIKLEANTLYRIIGMASVDTTVFKAMLDSSTTDLYQTLKGGEISVKVNGKGGSLKYQKWVTGKIGFVKASESVLDSVGTVAVDLSRTVGFSGEVKVRVSLDTANTTFKFDNGDPRYVIDGNTAFTAKEFTFADGATAAESINSLKIALKRDNTIRDASATGVVALKLEIVSGAAELTTINYQLKVTDDAASVSAKFIRYANTDGFTIPASTSYSSLKKVSGKLPSGVKATYNAKAKQIEFSGAPTKVESGSITYKIGSSKPVTIAFEVIDVAKLAKDDPLYNPYVGVARTVEDMAVIDYVAVGESDTFARLIGTLKLTLAANGKISAKYTTASGTVSFSGKGWNYKDTESADDDDWGEMKASLTAKNGYALTVSCFNDGTIEADVTDPAYDDSQWLDAYASATQWSKTNPASAYKGTYTAALLPAGTKVTMDDGTLQALPGKITETAEYLAPRGAGYLTMTLTSSSAINKGKVTWAGVLPDGKKISGSSVLTDSDAEYGCEGTASLPIIKKTGADQITLAVEIVADGATDPSAVCTPEFESEGIVQKLVGEFKHTDKTARGAYSMDMFVYGGYYDASKSLIEVCNEKEIPVSQLLGVDMTPVKEFGIGLGGVAGEVSGSTLTIAKNTVSAKGDVTLSLKRKTGVVSGKFTIPYTINGKTKKMSAKWTGVIIPGWKEGCGCGFGSQVDGLPFIFGSYYFNDKVQAETGKTITVTRGGLLETVSPDL